MGVDETSDDDLPPVELAVPLDTVCYIATRAHDYQGKVASTASDPDEYDDLAADIYEDRGPEADAVELELRSVIDDLDEEAQADLVALMWLGRADDGDWQELRALAAQEHTGTTASYLLGTPLLSDYLMAGLSELGFDCDEWLGEND